MASEMKGSGQDGTQYKPGGILLICTYPEEHGICGHVNNIVGIHEHFSIHTKCLRSVCKCGRQFAEQVYAGDHQKQCASFDCQPLTTTQAQEEENRSQKIKYIKVYNPPKVQLLKFRLVPWNQSEHLDLSNHELDDQKLNTAVQNEEEVIQDCNPEVQADQEPIREDQKEAESIEGEHGYESNEEGKSPIHDLCADRIASQAIHPHEHQALPTSSSPHHPIENPENFHDSDDDEYEIFGRPVTPSDEAAADTTAESHERNSEDQNRAVKQLDQSEAMYEDMDLQDEAEEPAYGDPRFNEIVDYFPSTKRRRI